MLPESLPFVPVALFYLICAIVSFFGNGTMVLCFIKERKFSSPCHYFITLTCAADLLHLSGHFVFNFQLFSGTTCSQELCFWMLLLTSVGLCSSSPLMLAMGVDRLLACQSPVIYRSLVNHQKLYLFIVLFCPLLYTLWLVFDAFIQKDPSIQVICQVPIAMSGSSFHKFNVGGLLINALVIVVYFLTFLKLRSFGTGGEQMKLVFKSILYTVSFVILGWSTVTICNTFAIKLVDDPFMLQFIAIHAGIGLNMACASNVFVFYEINTEYRESIRRLFGMKTSRHPNGSQATLQRSLAKTAVSQIYS